MNWKIESNEIVAYLGDKTISATEMTDELLCNDRLAIIPVSFGFARQAQRRCRYCGRLDVNRHECKSCGAPFGDWM